MGDNIVGHSSNQLSGPDAVTERAVQQANAGAALEARGDFAGARTHFSAAIQLCPARPDFHLRLGMCAWRQGDDAMTAERHLRHAVQLAPNWPAAHEAISQFFLEEGQGDLALHHVDIAAALAPADPSIAISRAFILAFVDEVDAAWKTIEPLIARQDISPRLPVVYARIAKRLGHQNQALALIDQVLEKNTGAIPERASLRFAAADLLDGLRRYDEAFEQARLAHEARRGAFDPRQNTTLTDGLIRYFTRSLLKSIPRASHGSKRPVFIVGMPRSGTSLLEQVLASHPDAHGAGELKTLGNIAFSMNAPSWARGKRFPHSVESITTARANELAEHYLSHLARLNPSAARVTDKLPLNFRDLWLVQILFPDSRIIHCTRDPRDTGLSCYMTDFATGNDFANNLADIGYFYRNYRRLMNHWQSVIEVPMLEINYETLVEDLEGQSRRLLDFVGIPWDEQCLSFYQNRRRGAAARKEHAHQPLYRSSVGRWQNYQGHLAPLFAVLDG